ncbi:hypothetical protein BHE97_01435 [Aeromicrobium sp. PE09-221]|uniref:hypothetical protein n=1 Tax=Aeromicrobium sp. PE09-221 TaxID=1898043 RepID=UPI000B3ECAB4|nr:hypothetical protein [Aeromicrobium sp. PE09-221]OUZ12408.1 hypothetical protein BHE97_01435 [Aeromicrobium sp. PE09-221]
MAELYRREGRHSEGRVIVLTEHDHARRAADARAALGVTGEDVRAATEPPVLRPSDPHTRQAY